MKSRKKIIDEATDFIISCWDEYCDYLERKLVGVKKGEIILDIGD